MKAVHRSIFRPDALKRYLSGRDTAALPAKIWGLMVLAIPRPWPLSLDHCIAALRTAVRKQRVRNTA